MIFHWFPTICYILTMEIPNFHIFIQQRCKKAHFEKIQDEMHYIILIKYTLLIKITTKTIIKTIGQNNQAFKIFLLRKKTLSIITKIFVLHTFNNIASFKFLKFCWLEQCINILKFKVSASKDCCFYFLLLPNLWKIAR